MARASLSFVENHGRLAPALENGKTHLLLNSGNVVGIIDMLRSNDRAAQYLALNARRLHETLLCPNCLKSFWARTIHRYRTHFGFDSRAPMIEELFKSYNRTLTPLDDLGAWFVGRVPV